MPIPVRAECHSRRLQWSMAAAWAVSVASMFAIALLPRPAAHASGTFPLAGSAASLIVVLAYARLLWRRPAPPRAMLVGGPWKGRMLLPFPGPMPEEARLAGPQKPPCNYRGHADDRDLAAVADPALQAWQRLRDGIQHPASGR